MVNGGARRKRGRAAGPALPEDLVLWEIFCRLRAKELLRCRVACRAWRRLSCDTEFLLAHHHRQPSLPLLLFRSTRCDPTTDASVDSLDLRRTPPLRQLVLGFNYYTRRCNLTVHASCDGLLLLTTADERFYICNPATRQWLELPLAGANIAALYPHRPSGEYRILYWKRPICDYSVVYYVLTVGSSHGQIRCIGLPVASPSMKYDDTALWLIHASDTPPALLHGRLHLYVKNKVVVFDTLVESFRWMQSPNATDSAHLLLIDDTFGIGDIHIDGDTVTSKVWVLRDYEEEVWSSKYPAELPETTGFTADHGKVVSEKGDTLLPNFRRHWLPSSLVHRDSKGKLLGCFQWQNAHPSVLGLSFKESLVRHAFFERKDGKCVRVPGFFRKL